jgi:Trk K+ transport system NAD-binding subunit
MYELRLPPDSAVVAVLREGHVVIPQPETRLVAGDELMAIATPETEEELRNAVLGEQTNSREAVRGGEGSA